MAEYNTITVPGTGEYEEKRSRFIGEAYPVTSEEEIKEHLSRIRKEYYDARHHCYAYVLGEKRDNKKASDDGEPSGTAGLPILKVIEGAGCTNILIVVTRYFGGTLLGTGGLVRAYTAAAKLSLEDAGPVQMREGEILKLTMEYSLFDRITYLLQQIGIASNDVQYTDKVSLQITVPAELVEEVCSKVYAAANAKIEIEHIQRGYFGFSL